MKIGCCIDISRYDTLVAYGYESIALAAKDIAVWDEETFQSAKKKLAEGKLKTISLNSFCTPELRLNGRDYDPEKVAEYTALVCRRGSELGFRYVGIGAPGSRNLESGEDPVRCRTQFLQALGILCTEAAKYDMEILLESVCSLECNFLTSTREALAVVRELGFPNLHLVYDIYHEYMENQSLDVIYEAGNEIRVVHIAQNVDNTRAYLDEAHLGEYEAYWNALQKIGYEGEWNLEAFVGEPEEMLPRSMKIMKKLKEG